MKSSITSQIRTYLRRNGPASVQAVVAAVLDLLENGAEERALLLMRLDPLLEPAAASKWAIRSVEQSDEEKVREAAEKHFSSLGRAGTPISSAISAISKATGIDKARVHVLLSGLYVVSGTNIFNRLKRQEEN